MTKRDGGTKYRSSDVAQRPQAEITIQLNNRAKHQREREPSWGSRNRP